MSLILQMWKDRSGGPETLALFSSIGGLLSAAGSIGSLFGGKKDKAPAPVPTVLAKEPTPAEPQVRQATDRARRRKAAAVGRKGTILTSPLGLTGDEDIARPSLLGR